MITMKRALPISGLLRFLELYKIETVTWQSGGFPFLQKIKKQSPPPGFSREAGSASFMTGSFVFGYFQLHDINTGFFFAFRAKKGKVELAYHFFLPLSYHVFVSFSCTLRHF